MVYLERPCIFCWVCYSFGHSGRFIYELPFEKPRIQRGSERKYASDHKRGTLAFCLLPMQNMLTVALQLITWDAFTHAKASHQVSSLHRNRRSDSTMSDMFMSASLRISHESRSLSIAGSPPERRPNVKSMNSAVAVGLSLSLSPSATHIQTHSHIPMLVSGLMQSTRRASNC